MEQYFIREMALRKAERFYQMLRRVEKSCLQLEQKKMQIIGDLVALIRT